MWNWVLMKIQGFEMSSECAAEISSTSKCNLDEGEDRSRIVFDLVAKTRPLVQYTIEPRLL
jgi:hypothetical protein